MKLKRIIMFLCFFANFYIYAQNNFEQIIYLKNGSIINGIIIEEIPNEKIKIQTKDGNIFEYAIEDIEKIAKKIPLKKENTIVTQPNSTLATQSLNTPTVLPSVAKSDKKNFYKKGFTSITEIGLAMDGLANELFNINKVKPIFGFNEVIASRTSQHFSIGMGFGIETGTRYKLRYSSSFYGNKRLLSVPVTLDMRIYFINKRVTPFLNLAPGYSFIIFDGDMGHTFISNSGLGIEYKIKEKIGVSFNGGYRLTLLPKALFKDNTSFNGSDNLIFHGGYIKFGFVY